MRSSLRLFRLSPSLKGLHAAALLAVLATSDAALAEVSEAAPVPPANCTGPESATWLKVVVENVQSNDGLIAITLYADDSSRLLVKHGSM